MAGLKNFTLYFHLLLSQIMTCFLLITFPLIFRLCLSEWIPLLEHYFIFQLNFFGDEFIAKVWIYSCISAPLQWVSFPLKQRGSSWVQSLHYLDLLEGNEVCDEADCDSYKQILITMNSLAALKLGCYGEDATPWEILFPVVQSAHCSTSLLLSKRSYSNFHTFSIDGRWVLLELTLFAHVASYYFWVGQMVKFSYFLVGTRKEVPTQQRTWHLDTICKSYEGLKFFIVELLELFLPHRYTLILEMYQKWWW